MPICHVRLTAQSEKSGFIGQHEVKLETSRLKKTLNGCIDIDRSLKKADLGLRRSIGYFGLKH